MRGAATSTCVAATAIALRCTGDNMYSTYSHSHNPGPTGHDLCLCNGWHRTGSTPARMLVHCALPAAPFLEWLADLPSPTLWPLPDIRGPLFNALSSYGTVTGTLSLCAHPPLQLLHPNAPTQVHLALTGRPG